MYFLHAVWYDLVMYVNLVCRELLSCAGVGFVDLLLGIFATLCFRTGQKKASTLSMSSAGVLEMVR